MLLFASPKSPWGQSMASAEGGNRLMKLLGMRGATPCQENPLYSLLSASGPLLQEDSGAGDSAWGQLPPAWPGTYDSLLPREAGRGAGGLH